MKIAFSEYKRIMKMSFNEFSRWITQFGKVMYEDGVNSSGVDPETLDADGWRELMGEAKVAAVWDEDELLRKLLSVRGIGEKTARKLMEVIMND